MKRLDKYFIKNFIITWGIIFFCFSLIFLSLQVNFYYARYFKFLSVKEYILLFIYTFLNILPIIFPISFILALAYLFGKWASEKKILSLKVLGFSFYKLNRSFIFLSFIFSIILGIYYFYTLPFLRKNFDNFLSSVFKKNFIYALKENEDNKIGGLHFRFRKREENNFHFVNITYKNTKIYAKKAKFLYKNNTLYLLAFDGKLESKSIFFTFSKSILKLIEISKNFFALKTKKTIFELLKSENFVDKLEFFVRLTISLSILSTSLFLLKYFYNKTVFDLKHTFKVSLLTILVFYSLYTICYIFSKKFYIPFLVIFPNILFLLLFLLLKER